MFFAERACPRLKPYRIIRRQHRTAAGFVFPPPIPNGGRYAYHERHKHAEHNILQPVSSIVLYRRKRGVAVYDKNAAEAKSAPPCANFEIYEVMKATRAVSRNKERKRDDQARRRYEYAPSARREPKAYTFKHSNLPPTTACFSSRKLPPQSAL